MSWKRLVILINLALPTSSQGYELATHTRLTEYAFLRSGLVQDDTLLQSLGIDQAVKEPFGSIYYDITGKNVTTRNTYIFEEDDGRMSNPGDALTIKGWLMRGAIREDDVPAPEGKNPQDEPGGPFYRVFNHFFDPVNNKPLTFLGQAAGVTSCAYSPIGCQPTETAPKWATGSVDPFADPNTADGNRRNHYTIFDAREAMYRALTKNEPDGDISEPEDVRKAYWATMFRALGDVLHLNQDMAQPQHTRNDAHAGDRYDGNGLKELVVGHKSFYESYIEQWALGLGFGVPGFDKQAPTVGLSIYQYPIPAFDKFSAYWSTAQGSGASYKGLADYSNRGFFSKGTNLAGNNFPSPSNNLAEYTIELLQPASPTNPDGATDMFGNPLGGYLKFWSRNVPDDLNPDLSLARLTTEGLWDQFLRHKGALYGWTLNRYNYDHMADRLVPRAVAYSAGILNYFFRGRMEISPPDEGVYSVVDHSLASANAIDTGGFKKVKLKVKNTTVATAGSAEQMTGGDLIAVIKFHRNTCYEPIKLSGQANGPGYNPGCRKKQEEIVVSESVSATPDINGIGQAVTFNFPDVIPINAIDVYLQVVYRGKLGNEDDAVVVATKDIAEPTFFNFDNYSDCYRIYDGTYVKTEGFALTASVSFNKSSPSAYVAGVTGLPPNSYGRIALLADYHFFLAISSAPVTAYVMGVVNQKDNVPLGVTNPTKLYKGRPTNDGGNLYAYFGWGYYPYEFNGEFEDGYLGGQNCEPMNPVPAAVDFLVFD